MEREGVESASQPDRQTDRQRLKDRDRERRETWRERGWSQTVRLTDEQTE